jgi:hypothetical protein
VQLNDLYDLFNLDALDLTLFRCFILKVAWKFNLLLTNVILYRIVLFASHHFYYHVFCLLTLCFFLTNRNMTVEVDNKSPAVGYLDPECLCSTTLNSRITLLLSLCLYAQCLQTICYKGFNTYHLS